MCGIAGFLTTEARIPDGALLERMCTTLTHRGPDAHGYFCDSHAALGHRRLSIIDTTGGQQPLGNEDGTIQVVFNGEIYNFEELRRDLLEKGHHFATRSDTEVLVHLYEEVGDRLPSFLNGMFAFAIWDSTRQELFLARDRLGKKPLYYSLSGPGMRFCFASELKALAAVPGFDGAVNYRALADFLSFGYVPDPDTIYEQVSKLPPGHHLTVRWSGAHLRKYWTPQFESEGAGDLDDTVEEIAALAVEAVKCRMISDVPLGAFLSGGVDSSAVAAILAARTPGRAKTFSIGFAEEDYDERRFARMVAKRYGTEHHEQVVSPAIEDMLGTAATHFDEPFGDASAIPTLHLARTTRQHVTVALGGDGADELFGGYRRYYFGVLEERLRSVSPEWFRQSVIKAGAHYYPKFDYLPQVFRAKTLLTNLSQQIGDSYCTSMSVFREADLSAVLSPETRRTLGSYSPSERFRRRFEAVRHLGPLEQMQAVDFETYLPGDILVKLDRATMAHSLEARSPWLDYRLAELACRLPAAFKLSGTRGKHAFKLAMAPYVPAELIERRKVGFVVPLAGWFRSSLGSTFRDLVNRPEMEQYVSLPEVKRLWEEHQSGARNHERKLWNLLMLACWDARWRRASCTELAALAS
jgi:asparagine synthase (glutamine-hydrolysing)